MESEAQTRKKRIDTKLRDAGWTIVPFKDGMKLASLAHHAIEEYPTANGPADYALVSSGQLVGVVEAKKVTVGPKGVLVQAERYSQGVNDSPFNFVGYRVPLLYSTNGEVIYFHDVRHSQNTSRKLAQFHTPEALQEMLGTSFAETCDWFSSNPNNHPKLRSYQRDANTAVEAAIAKGKRQMLVAMATGTGKTFTTVNQAYRLLKSGGAKRILFLVDRRALAAQAVRAFASFEPEPNLKFDKIYEVYSNRFQKEDFGEEDKFDAKVMPNDYLTDPQPKHVFVYVCTIQRMAISILGRGAVFEGEGDDIDSDANQLPIPIHAFDAIIADECHRGYTASEQSVWRAEHLDTLEDEREFATTDVERKVTSPDSNRKILQELKKYADEHEKRYGRFPKTLIFAANDLPHTSHADELVDLAVNIFERGELFVRKITGRVDRPLQRIREFRNRPNPGIVVTVDLLSTGVDIPDLEFIVLLRAVKSRILFEQMLGRGTRKGEHHPDKSHFTVFDCFDGTWVDFFRKSTSMTTEPPTKPSRTIQEIIDDIWDNRDRDYNVRCLVKRLHRIEKEMSGEARDEFAAFGIPDGDVGKFATGLATSLKTNFIDAMKLLKNEPFQKLLVDYDRKEKVFLRAIEYTDTVSSTYLVREGGVEYKPEDYLTLFERFVRDNPEHIEAIRILLERPAGWSTDALKELKAKLMTSSPRFTIENLQKAHHLRYDKALVDIISMVKHAASALEGAGGWGKANMVFDGKLIELLLALNAALAA